MYKDKTRYTDTETVLIRTTRYYGHFALSHQWGKKALVFSLN